MFYFISKANSKILSPRVKKFAAAGVTLSAIIAAIPIAIFFGRPYWKPNLYAEIRSEQLKLQAQRKTPIDSFNLNPKVSPSPSSTEIPSVLKLDVPFTPQAPTTNWDELHNEACEEASAIMANAYFNGIALNPSIAENEIFKLTAWQQEKFGYHLSITTLETAQMIEEFYNLKASVASYSEQAIKQSLNSGKLIIIPASGTDLENPYFKQPGPKYHMLVITGYDQKGFFTNDPGTKRGQDFHYDFEQLKNAVGSYSHNTEQVNTALKQMIVVSKS